MERDDRRQGHIFLLAYSLMWLVCAGSILAVFAFARRSFLFVPDGVYQHLTAFEYVCRAVRALLHGNPANVGFYSFSLGMGADVLTTLNSYDFTDPICWVMALLPGAVRSRYTAMIFVKLYLIGLSFGLYCRVTGRRNGLYNALGAIAYTFNGAILFTMARHPNYINWAYCLPLIMAGGERYWREGRRGLLIGAVLLNLVISYYTFYINAVLFALFTIVRALWRWRTAPKPRRLGPEVAVCFRTAGVCLLGVLLGMVVLLPALYAYANNARLPSGNGLPPLSWHYPLKYYKQMLIVLLSCYDSAGFYTHIGINAVAFMTMAVTLFDRRRRGLQKLCLLGMGLMLACPLAGRLMNGMDYASNRWIYAIMFLSGVMLVDALPVLGALASRKRTVIALALLGYAVFYVVFPGGGRLKRIGAALTLAVSAATLWLCGRLNRRHRAAVLSAAVFVCALYHSALCFMPGFGGYVKEFLPEAQARTFLEDHSIVAAAGIKDDGFYRVEEMEPMTNLEMYSDVRGTSWWWSLLGEWMSDYYNAYRMDSLFQNCNFLGLDGRPELLATASVKYYTAPAEDKSSIPWGYERVKTKSDKRFALYRNRHALPVGYVYQGYMLSEDYDRLDVVERQQAQMKCAVLDAPMEGCEPTLPALETLPLACEITELNDVEIREGELKAAAGGSIRMRVEVPEETTLYILLDGLKLKNHVKGELLEIDVRRVGDDFDLTKAGRVFSRQYTWPVLRDQVSYCMGSGAPGENEITLTFNKKARLAFAGVRAVAVPMAPYADQAERLRASAMRDVRVSRDALEGRLSVDAPGILQLSIPYSAGWKVRIDGASIPVVRSNIMYMAVPVEAGEHSVLIEYHTPGLSLGAAITLVTLIAMLAAGIVSRRRRSA